MSTFNLDRINSVNTSVCNSFNLSMSGADSSRYTAVCSNGSRFRCMDAIISVTSCKLCAAVTVSCKFSVFPCFMRFLFAALLMILFSSAGVTCLVYIRSVTPSISPRYRRIACSSVAVGYSLSAQTHRKVFPQI